MSSTRCSPFDALSFRAANPTTVGCVSRNLSALCTAAAAQLATSYLVTADKLTSYERSWKYWCTLFRMSSTRCSPFGALSFRAANPTTVGCVSRNLFAPVHSRGGAACNALLGYR